MDEYISREAVLQTLQKANIGGYITERLLEIPSADIQSVKHGRWMYPFYCSECGFEPYYSSSDLTYNYCPNCGARMDGDA